MTGNGPVRVGRASSARRRPAGAGLREATKVVLRQLFSVQDTLSEAQAVVVASRIEGCTAEQALEYFQELRVASDKVFRRAAKRARLERAAIEDSAGGGKDALPATDGRQDAQVCREVMAQAEVDAAAAARQAARNKLQPILDAVGGLRDSTVTGQFVSLMSSLSSSVVRCEAAEAVAATRHAIRVKLVTTAGFLTTLEGWLEEATEQQQYTLMRLVVCALASLPLQPSLLRSSVDLLRWVRQLQHHRHQGVGAAAAQLHQHWQQLLSGGEDVVGAGAGAHAAVGQPGAVPARPTHQPDVSQQQQPVPQQELMPSRPLAPSGHARSQAVPELVALGRKGIASCCEPPVPGSNGSTVQPGLRGYKSLAVTGSRAAAAQRPMSADDIRRQQARQRQQAQLQALRMQAEAAAGGREAGSGVQPQGQPQTCQQPSNQQQQQQQQQLLLPSHQQQQQQSLPGVDAVRSSSLFQKLRRSIAAARAASGQAPSSSSGAYGAAAGETATGALKSNNASVSVAIVVNGGAEVSKLQRLESVSSVHTCTSATHIPQPQEGQEQKPPSPLVRPQQQQQQHKAAGMTGAAAMPLPMAEPAVAINIEEGEVAPDALVPPPPLSVAPPPATAASAAPASAAPTPARVVAVVAVPPAAPAAPPPPPLPPSASAAEAEALHSAAPAAPVLPRWAVEASIAAAPYENGRKDRTLREPPPPARATPLQPATAARTEASQPSLGVPVVAVQKALSQSPRACPTDNAPGASSSPLAVSDRKRSSHSLDGNQSRPPGPKAPKSLPCPPRQQQFQVPPSRHQHQQQLHQPFPLQQQQHPHQPLPAQRQQHHPPPPQLPPPRLASKLARLEEACKNGQTGSNRRHRSRRKQRQLQGRSPPWQPPRGPEAWPRLPSLPEQHWQRRQQHLSVAPSMATQVAWQPPAAILMTDAVAPPAFGEQSTEVGALAEARQNQPNMQSPRMVPLQPSSPRGGAEEPYTQLQMVPYVPMDLDERREEEQRLRVAGWQAPHA